MGCTRTRSWAHPGPANIPATPQACLTGKIEPWSSRHYPQVTQAAEPNPDPRAHPLALRGSDPWMPPVGAGAKHNALPLPALGHPDPPPCAKPPPAAGEINPFSLISTFVTVNVITAPLHAAWAPSSRPAQGEGRGPHNYFISSPGTAQSPPVNGLAYLLTSHLLQGQFHPWQPQPLPLPASQPIRNLPHSHAPRGMRATGHQA